MSAQGYMMALQAAGGIIQSIAANKASQEMRDAVQRELIAQTRFRNQAFDVTQKGLPLQGAEEARRSLAENKQQREGKYAQANEMQFGPGSANASERDKLAIGMAGSARAGVGAYSDWQLEQMIKRLRAQERLNKISNFSAGQSAIFPSRLSDAQHSQDELGAFGAFLQSFGGAGSNMSAYGGTNKSDYVGGNGTAGGYDYNTPSRMDENNQQWS